MKSLEENTKVTYTLMALGLLTEAALLSSMSRSKTLTTMVVLGITGLAGLSYFLFSV